MTAAYPNRTRFLWKRYQLQRVRNLDLWTWIRHPHSVRFLRSSRVSSRAPQNSAPEPLWKLIKNMTITNNGRWTVAALRGRQVDGTGECARAVCYVNNKRIIVHLFSPDQVSFGTPTLSRLNGTLGSAVVEPEPRATAAAVRECRRDAAPATNRNIPWMIYRMVVRYR